MWWVFGMNRLEISGFDVKFMSDNFRSFFAFHDLSSPFFPRLSLRLHWLVVLVVVILALLVAVLA